MAKRPLSRYRVIEMAGIGPGPYAAMMLADMGAEVIRIERSQAVSPELPKGPQGDIMLRGRRSIGINLKDPVGVELLLELIASADALIEGFRPGVMERLGVGPEVCLARNPKLVYGRMTGWGQVGPYASTAGHDINYISLAGVLAHIRREGERPIAPLNLVGDFGGGGMFMAFGIVTALLEAKESGLGQVVDAAMVDGAASLMTFLWGMHNTGLHDLDHPGTSFLDTGAPFYDVYECADGLYVSIGSLEAPFYEELLRRTGLDQDDPPHGEYDRTNWPRMRARLTEVFKTKTRDQWCTEMEGTDVCFAPVLTAREAVRHPHNVERGTFVEVEGFTQPAPAPRLSRTPASLGTPPAHPGQHSRDILRDWGIASDRAEALIADGVVVHSK